MTVNKLITFIILKCSKKWITKLRTNHEGKGTNMNNGKENDKNYLNYTDPVINFEKIRMLEKCQNW